MNVANTPPDSRFGGAGPGGMLLPINKFGKPKAPEMDVQPFQQRWQMMRLEAMSKWYQRWRDISRYINPKRGFFEGFVPNYNAQYDYRLIIDDTPAHYARVLAAGMQSGLTSPAMPWLRLGFGRPDIEARADVANWLEYTTKVVLDIFAGSNFYDCTHQSYEELGMFGTASFGMFEDYKSVIRCRSHTIGEYYLSTDSQGRVNGFARQYWMTCDQMVEEYGWENLSDKAKAIYNSSNRDQYILLHTLCEANTSRVPGLADFRGMPFRTVTWEAVSPFDRALRVEGYHEFPYMCPRWDMTTTADIYGVGPGSFALGNIKMLYRMQKDSLLAIAKMADPPVQADASVEGAVNMIPGGVTRTTSTVPNGGVRSSYEVKPDIGALEAKINSTDKKIATRFYADLFLMMIDADARGEGGEKTAREIVERHEEKLFMLGPVIGRIKSDLLDPAVERCLAIAIRQRLIPPPPKIIQGLNLKPQYISMLAQAQKMAGTAAIEQEASFVGTLAGAFPEAKDLFNPDEAIRAHSDMVGAPPKMIRSPEEVAQIREARMKAMQAQQDQANALAAVQGAANLSKAQVGGGNALEHILGVGREPITTNPGPGALQ